MVVNYQGEEFETTDEELDQGYAAEAVTLYDLDGNEVEVGGCKGHTQVLVTIPFLNKKITEEITNIEKDVNDFIKPHVDFNLILNSKDDIDNKEASFSKFKILTDDSKEFGEYYGVRIAGGSLKDKLIKGLFVVPKDGSLFYDELLEDLESSFNVSMLYRRLISSLSHYTGVGCHG